MDAVFGSACSVRLRSCSGIRSALLAQAVDVALNGHVASAWCSNRQKRSRARAKPLRFGLRPARLGAPCGPTPCHETGAPSPSASWVCLARACTEIAQRPYTADGQTWTDAATSAKISISLSGLRRSGKQGPTSSPRESPLYDGARVRTMGLDSREVRRHFEVCCRTWTCAAKLRET